ncbi:MAG: tetratricopeptide repeat protein [Bacteroidales bacterium]
MMQIRRSHLLLLILSMPFAGCQMNGDKNVSGVLKSNQEILMDSLQKLDSLVLQYRVKNADTSMELARLGEKLAFKINTPAARAKADNISGNARVAVNPDSALYFYNKALLVVDSFNLAEIKGKVLYNLAMLKRSAGDYQEHILLLDSALRCSVLVNDPITKSNSLNALGTFYFNTGEVKKAKTMFDSAFSVAVRSSLYLQMGSALGNQARFEADPVKSVAQQRRAIAYLEKGGDGGETVAFSLINIGYRSPNPDSAIFYFDQAISKVTPQFAPEIIMGAYNNLAYCYLAKGDLIRAEQCITEHALPVAEKTNNVDWQSTIYDTYGDILMKKGNEKSAKDYKTRAGRAKDKFREITTFQVKSIK